MQFVSKGLHDKLLYLPLASLMLWHFEKLGSGNFIITGLGDFK